MHGGSFPTSSPKPSFQLSIPALVSRRRGLMSRLAEGTADYLRISSTLVFWRHCFLPGSDWEQKWESMYAALHHGLLLLCAKLWTGTSDIDEGRNVRDCLMKRDRVTEITCLRFLPRNTHACCFFIFVF